MSNRKSLTMIVAGLSTALARSPPVVRLLMLRRFPRRR